MDLEDIVRGLRKDSQHLWPQVVYHGRDFLQQRPKLPFHKERENVFLLHGYAARGCSLDYIATRLYEEGYNALPFHYYFWNDLNDVAATFARYIAHVHQQQNQPRKVHLIGHSMGGLLVCDTSRYVPSLVATTTSLGTPFSGAEKARYVPGRSAEQIIPGSDYLRHLYEQRWPEDITYHIVQARDDWIVPRTDGDLPQNQENIIRHQLDTSHLGLVGPKGYTLIQTILRGGINVEEESE